MNPYWVFFHKVAVIHILFNLQWNLPVPIAPVVLVSINMDTNIISFPCLPKEHRIGMNKAKLRK